MGGQAKLKQVGEPEAPAHRIHNNIGHLPGAVRDKDHPYADIAGLIHPEVDQLQRSVKFTWSIAKWPRRGVLDEGVANPKVAKHAGQGALFVVDEVLMHNEITFLVERVAKPADDEAAHRRRVAEPHFGLRRVNVYVDLLEWNFDKQGRDRLTVARDQVAIGSAQRSDE